eukprot:TRINITY_DN3793_c1_g1_i1.p1 TRINITY_DN3793_c1_g1~~TRINITY_DN3793_c1_g1_i1.p1  ORF type:complete len:499 (+),score=164.49 TRINITY_DN3793_c1_g1_i1:72-1568(+)
MSHQLCPKCGGSGRDPKPIVIKRCLTCGGIGAVRVGMPSLAPQGLALIVRTSSRLRARSVGPAQAAAPPGSPQFRPPGDVAFLGEYASGPIASTDRGLSDLVLQKPQREGEATPPVSPVALALDRQNSFQSCISEVEEMEGGITIVTKQVAIKRRASFGGAPHVQPSAPSPLSAASQVAETPGSSAAGEQSPSPTPRAAPPAAEEQPQPAGLRRRGTMFRPRHKRELPGGVCGSLPDACVCRCVSTWDFTAAPDNVEHLKQGGALFACCPGPGSILQDTERGIISTFINMSVFEDEVRDNGVLPVDMDSEEDLAAHIFLLSKTMYLLPPCVDSSALADVDLFSSYEFQKATQPSGAKVFEPDKVRDRDGRAVKHTFCVTKPIIPWVLSITTQFRVSHVPADQLHTLSALCDGLPVHRALLLERTKQDRGQDATKRAKQVLLLHDVPGGGVAVATVAFSIFTQLPSVARRLIDKVGAKGAEEVQDTAQRTRKWFRKRAR